jgi:ATP-dependent helicase/nuclease subunit A
MTRAEEALFVGGALSAREKEPAPESWYAKLRLLFGADDWVDDTVWNARLEWGAMAEPVAEEAKAAEQHTLALLPHWLTSPPPAEPRPPKPLTPSALGEDVSPDPPFPAGAGAEAARRGTLVHKLLERLPEVAPEERHAAASRWLALNAPELDAAGRDDLLASVFGVLGNADWQDLFAASGLAEVPIAALVGGRVVAGTIDRLAIEPDRIRLVDFKTARRPPASLEQVPVAALRQMAAYAAALGATYPGRRVEAALLYTAAPRLIAIPDSVLAEHKQALLARE